LEWGIPDYNPQYPCIGLLHGDVDKPESGYHPFRLDELAKNEVNLWLLGHIHKAGKLRENPAVWYTGSPQAMSAKEPGNHGPLLINVSESGQINVEQIALSPIIYTTLEVTVSVADDETRLRDRIVTELVRDAQEKENEIPELLAAVYQIKLKGEHPDIKEVERWTSQITQFSQQLRRLTVSVRNVRSQLQPALQNLEELAASRSPAGVLASTILAITNGISTPFLERLITDWKNKAGNVYQAGTYTPLLVDQRLERPGDKEALTYILEECNRSLAELNRQLTLN